MGLIAKLLGNGLRHKYLALQGRPLKPRALSIEITHRCVARCLMCNIWKTPASQPELGVEDWLRLLDNDLFSELVELDVTGGEPFLKENIAQLFIGIAGLATGNLANLKSIAVTSNGYLTEAILPVLDRVLPILRARGIDLVMVCAMDAVGELHDKIRRLDGIFAKLSQTIDGLMGLRKAHGNLVIGLKTTILPMNVEELQAIADFADERGLFTIISPCIITSGRYLNPDMKDDFLFNSEQKQQMIDFFESGDSRWSYHNQIVIDYLVNGQTHKPCTCGFNYFFVRSNGEVLLCPLISQSFGKLKSQNIKHIYFSHDADEFRKKVGKLPQCASCTEPGLERYALPFEGFKYLSTIPRIGLKKFIQLHQHMGLDKYV
jgi:MoaA/NifB/PqqE/SkfB family radical SAM enzyme